MAIAAVIGAFGFVVVGAAIVVAPYVHPLVDWPFAFALLFGIAILGGRQALVKPTRAILFPIVVGVLSLPPMLVAAGFAKFDVYAVIHHLQFGMMDADLGIVLRSLTPLISAIGLFVLGLFLIKNLLRLGNRVYWYGGVLIATINPLTLNVFDILTTPSYDSDLSVRMKAPAVVAPSAQADVVIVYLEGLDRSFADRAQFGDVYAPLEQLGREAITFTGIRQIQGTGWSLAGLVASQCGLPLIPNGIRNFYRFETQTSFIADHMCLSDVLADQGYQNNFIVGGAIGFGGQDHFLNTHQFHNFQGKQAISAQFDRQLISRATAARNLDDQLVFDVALDTYADLVKSPTPFSLVVETIGPHGDSGTLSRNCTVDGQAIETGDLNATVECTITNLMRFLGGLSALRNERPTLLVILSDHLNHAWPKERGRSQGTRTNTAMIMGMNMPDVAKGITIDRPGSMIDIYPTILTLLGKSDLDAQAGLGVSLLGPTPTLVEEKGFVRFNHELTRNSELSLAIWGGQ